MFEYEVAYEMQNGERRTCFLASYTRYTIVKAAQHAEKLLTENEPGDKRLVEVKEHIYS